VNEAEIAKRGALVKVVGENRFLAIWKAYHPSPDPYEQYEPSACHKIDEGKAVMSRYAIIRFNLSSNDDRLRFFASGSCKSFSIFFIHFLGDVDRPTKASLFLVIPATPDTSRKLSFTIRNPIVRDQSTFIFNNATAQSLYQSPAGSIRKCPFFFKEISFGEILRQVLTDKLVSSECWSTKSDELSVSYGQHKSWLVSPNPIW
jgi:hypothetical protein